MFIKICELVSEFIVSDDYDDIPNNNNQNIGKMRKSKNPLRKIPHEKNQREREKK